MSEKSFGDEKTLPPDSGGGKGYDLVAGEVLGDYQILKPLGRGGMGQVYVAENRVNGRKVALKLLPTDATGVGFVDRFRVESRVMSDLDHPGIVRVHHAGVDKGRHYLTMDYVEGPEGQPRTLADVLDGSQDTGYGIKDKGGLNEEQIRDIALQICDALAYAHGKGIIHRDLKPANILLGQDGCVRIADFGLAKVVGEDFVSAMVKKSISLSMGRSIGDDGGQRGDVRGQDLSLGEVETQVPRSGKRAAYEGTSTGALLGTYDYMSPEQKAGAEVTKQSDIYAFGVILYRMLTGRKPEGMAKPPSHFGCDPRWDAIVDKCLEHDFLDRYADVGEIKVALKGMGKKKRSPVPVLLLLACGVGAGLWWSQRRAEVPVEEIPIVEAVDLEKVESVPLVGSDEGSAMQTVALQFSITPPQARVTVFNARGLVTQQALTGGDWETELPPDTYELEIQKDGYRMLTPTITVSEENKRFSYTLSPLRGGLALNTTPEARVSATPVSGGAPIQLGRADAMGQLDYDRLVEGRYTLQIRHPDYEEAEVTVRIRRDDTEQITRKLQGKPGSVYISASPAAGVWMGGEEIGRTGSLLSGLSPGPQTFEVRKSGYRTEHFELTVPPNQSLRHNLGVLSPESGAVKLVLEVPDYAREFFRTSEVEVRVGSERRKLAAGAVEWVQEGLPVGEVEVGVQSSGFKVQSSGFAEGRGQRVEVRDGERAEVRVALEPLPARVTLTGAPAGARVRLQEGSDMSDVSDIAVPSLRAGTLRVSAPRHQEAVVQVPVLRPGERRSLAVRMEEIRGPTDGQHWTSPASGMEFVWIGAMKMWVGKYEVTNGEYRRYVPGHNSRKFQGHSLNGDRQPVVYVNFDDAKAFAAWMTERDRAAGLLPEGFRYRLPAEKEWETFAKAGKDWEYPWGNNWPPKSGEAGNYHGQEGAGSWPKISGYRDGNPVTAPVEKSWANPWGLYGVGGNVWEIAARDASNGSSGAWRGASWYYNLQDYLRVSYRYGYDGSRRSYHGGFRLVLSR